ncbi:MAG: tRNA glutamyl-Q(34) synthetase GluQRS [Gammaproteobacteria bacterium]|nr:tRNA glutamyl-Q(34) synthetase GluQRS [Gammaproteobacteria bacterium]
MSQQSFFKTNTQYRGRFAPSPSGDLHFGSLVAALGSFLQAKKNDGQWFVRIEDIDKPREQLGAAEQILATLNSFGMHWDTDSLTHSPTDNQRCIVQSQRIERYEHVLEHLITLDRIYACQCTRKQIKQLGDVYTGTCRDLCLPFKGNALRVQLPNVITAFEDVLHGMTHSAHSFAHEDFIVKRKDDLFAYQLVVVVDDIDQGITEVVRGADIMPLTCRQLSLYQLFDVPPPSYLHLPLAVNQSGLKLSKQNHASPINSANPKPELIKAFEFLSLPIHEQLQDLTVDELILWGIKHWDVSRLPKQQEIYVP